ncbi:hypothetical protein LV164_000743 [Aspergillus fumigatus]|nr:hypothetical protein KXX57_008945 [Aspergillus fumigatus]KAH1624430.1 hypothetical protein KXX21_007013 [Aspergillus fumigatus]KAH1983403.1 hypothetical protein KXW88_003337 [Aspergillus fumigatus]KAH2316431.1 hypothetical protein KXV47_001121 [Aspergillus fumigatus]KAH2662165.1 hypothetical protein KXV32_009407 [Aspergillus fumigatus]
MIKSIVQNLSTVVIESGWSESPLAKILKTNSAYPPARRFCPRKMSFSRIRVPREAYRFSAAMLVHGPKHEASHLCGFWAGYWGASYDNLLPQAFWLPSKRPQEDLMRWNKINF